MAKFDANRVIEHLKQKWQGKPCPMCGHGNWKVQDSTYQLIEFNEGRFVLGGSVIPIVPVTCSNCGNTVLINAIMAGTVKRKEES